MSQKQSSSPALCSCTQLPTATSFPLFPYRFVAYARLPVRSQSGSLVLKPRLLAEHTTGNVSVELLARCPSVQDSEWTECTGTLYVPVAFTDSTVSSLRVEVGATPGIDFDIDNISLVVSETDQNTLIVDNSVEGKWMPGAEILVTSHTTQWDGHQVRRIEHIKTHEDDRNYTELTLDSPIPRPTTVRDNPMFAVEVALLSRNILFQGGPDSNPLHGGHFWIIHTPGARHLVEGVEVKNFGQQGTLGRYPIHLHFCGDNEGSILSKNTVRDSNQRGIVIHGTHNVRLEENIVFNTKGHGIMLEDGFETGNVFVRNLGAATERVDDVIPDNGFNGKESDDVCLYTTCCLVKRAFLFLVRGPHRTQTLSPFSNRRHLRPFGYRTLQTAGLVMWRRVLRAQVSGLSYNCEERKPASFLSFIRNLLLWVNLKITLPTATET